MVILKTTLEEFIQRIPTCHKDSNWEIIVSAIRQSPKGMVAFVDTDGKPKGIIKSNDLLRMISKKFINSKNALGRNFNAIDSASLQVKTAISLNDLEDIITPLVTLPCQMRIKYFLQRFAFQERQAQNYLIVDTADKLLGILDTDKLLQTLWHHTMSDSKVESNLLPNVLVSFNKDSVAKKIKLTNPNNYWKKSQKLEIVETSEKPQKLSKTETKFQKEYPGLFSLLNQIALPLLIENTSQEVCYQNYYWRSQSSTNILKTDFNNYFSTNSSISYRKKILDVNTDSYYPVSNLSSLLPLSSLRLDRQMNQLDSSLPEYRVKQKSADNSILEGTNKFELSENVTSWYYSRIPLNIRHNTITIANDYNYWLTFATPFSLQKFLLERNLSQDDLRNDSLKQLQDEFLFNIGHDFKSPLTAIIGLSSLLKEEKLGTLNQRQINYTETIYNSGKRLANLTDDFLNFTHLTSQKLQFNFESLDLEDICQQVYQQVKEKLTTIAENKNAVRFPELKLDIAPNAKIAIADKTYLHQILTILVENALHLTNCDQLLSVTTELWSQWLAITVWNEEGGLTKEQQNLLTRDFSEHSNFLTSQEKNQALKLILAQQLAQAHGGDISFISQDHCGSEFTLLLPLKGDCTNQELNNSLVLIIETASDKISDLSKKLKTLGYYSAIARNHTEALYKAKLLKPGKILLNYSFLEDEPQIVETLKFDLQTRDVPLLITTDASSIDSFSNVADGVLSFPISRNTLAQYFTPVVSRQSVVKHNLTVLRLSLIEDTTQPRENLALDFVFDNPAFSLSHHIIEADSIEQAHLLAKIWSIDVVIWDGTTLKSPEAYLHFFAKSEVLASIPVITLDAKTTAAANKITNLAVFPCLLPANERSIKQLTLVIQIAAGIS